MRNFELTIILNPAIEEEGISGLLDKVVSILTKDGGELIETNKWGLRRLAYPIRDQKKGYYILLRLRATPHLVSELERYLKLSDDLLRFLFISIEAKEAAEEVKQEGGD